MTNINLQLELNNTLELVKGEYVGAISVETIAALMNEGLLNADRSNVNKEKVDDIRELLLEGKLIATQLEISIQDKNLVEYYPESNKLILHEGATLNIVDGYHRCLAAQQAFNINPNLSFNFTSGYNFNR